jgi:hypothetical protein
MVTLGCAASNRSMSLVMASPVPSASKCVRVRLIGSPSGTTVEMGWFSRVSGAFAPGVRLHAARADAATPTITARSRRRGECADSSMSDLIVEGW